MNQCMCRIGVLIKREKDHKSLFFCLVFISNNIYADNHYLRREKKEVKDREKRETYKRKSFSIILYQIRGKR